MLTVLVRIVYSIIFYNYTLYYLYSNYCSLNILSILVDATAVIHTDCSIVFYNYIIYTAMKVA
jgi:hypothetical protein